MTSSLLNMSLYTSMFTRKLNLIKCVKHSRYISALTSLKQSNNIISEEVRKTFQFTDYDCIGFDLDNTICRYKLGPMIKMEYETLVAYLVNEKKYSPKYLTKPIEQNLDFLLKGLILDFNNGNILKINMNGQIVHASHGTKYLTQQEIEKQYGVDCHWNITDIFIKNLLSTWNGPLSEKMRTLLDYFDMPTGLAFARIVDTLDENAGKRLDNYQIWPDILEALIDMFDTKHFQQNMGGYFPKMKSDPNAYIEKCDRSVLKWFKTLKANKKKLFLITGSYVDFASLTASTSMGDDWKDLFDVVIFYAKKPGFFTDSRPFLGVNPKSFELETLKVARLTQGGWYVQGNWTELYQFLGELTGKPEPKVVYVGDNLIQDIYTPSVHTQCDTVAVVEELQAEGAFGFTNNHSHSKYLTSETWGSFFECQKSSADNIWLDIIRKHSKLCVPSMEYICKKPIDYKYEL